MVSFNAIRYSENNSEKNIEKNQKSKINIILKNNILKISDNWVWISKENLKKIFERFYQGWDCRESSEWFWIWLSLVKKICDEYWLKISVNSEKWKGSEFIVRF